ncbi:DUF7224 domain-containing protein [Streptomyces laurentii]|uniref:DUF7224 domain-containing protein n=1 Tax=Streptomyces laurentii TaxID=39478 RepID=UPI0033F8BBB2
MLKTYLTELRRSPLLTAFPVMVAVDLAVLFGRSRYWIGVWPEASVAAQIVTLFLGPVLAGVSAWQAGRASRAGMPEFLLAAARPAWRIEAARLAATLTLGFLAYGIGCVVAAAVSFRDAGPGFLWPSYLLLGAATLVIFASVGHLAGRLWPSPGFTPIVCALGCFISMLSLPFRFNVLAGPPDTHLNPLPLAVRLFVALTLAVLAVAAPSLPRKSEREITTRELPWRTRGVVLVSAVGAGLALTAAPAAGELRGERPATATTPLCERADENAPSVCVWPEHRKYLPELTRMAQRLDVRPSRPWIRPPAEFREFGLARTRLGDPGFDIAEGHVRTAAIAMADQVFRTSFGWCTPPRGKPEARRAWQAIDNLHMWLEYQATGQDPDVADEGLHQSGVDTARRNAAQAVRMSPPDQEKWIAEERGHLRENTWCEPDARF